MRNKTLTVDDFLDKKFIEFENLDNRYIWDNTKNLMIEFAKIHVKESLKTAAKKAIEMYQWENKKISKKSVGKKNI